MSAKASSCQLFPVENPNTVRFTDQDAIQDESKSNPRFQVVPSPTTSGSVVRINTKFPLDPVPARPGSPRRRARTGNDGCSALEVSHEKLAEFEVLDEAQIYPLMFFFRHPVYNRRTQ
jgi:hypothetical protein